MTKHISGLKLAKQGFNLSWFSIVFNLSWFSIVISSACSPLFLVELVFHGFFAEHFCLLHTSVQKVSCLAFGLVQSRVYFSMIADVGWFYHSVVEHLGATIWRGSHTPDKEQSFCKPVGGQPPHQVVREELDHVEEAEDHPVGQPPVFLLLLLVY